MGIKNNFICPKCSCVKNLSRKIYSKDKNNIALQEYILVSCNNCGYTEIYNTNIDNNTKEENVNIHKLETLNIDNIGNNIKHKKIHYNNRFENVYNKDEFINPHSLLNIDREKLASKLIKAYKKERNNTACDFFNETEKEYSYSDNQTPSKPKYYEKIEILSL